MNADNYNIEITTGLGNYGTSGLGTKIDTLENRVYNLEENQITGVLVYTTYADLPATGALLISYKVSNDPDSSKNGYYHWDGAVYIQDEVLNQDILTELKEVNVRTFEVLGAAVPETIAFGVSSTFASFIPVSQHYYYASDKMYIDTLVESLTDLTITVKAGVTEADFKVMFFRAAEYTVVNKVHEVEFLAQTVVGNEIVLDLSTLDVYANALYGCYIAVKCTSAFEVLKYNATGANSFYINTFDSRLTTSTRDLQIELNVIRAVGDVRSTQSSLHGLIRQMELGGNNVCQSGDNLQEYINNNRIVNLLPITYTIESPLIIPSNTKIRGVDGQTVIKAGNGAMTSLILIDDESHISIECVKLEGFAKNTTVLTGLADVKAKTGIGVQSGIYITDECYYVSISKVYCLFMSRAGIEVGGLTAFGYIEGVHVDKCWFNSCYIGLFLDAQGEYGQYTDMTMNECQIGLWSDAGNIILSGINSNYNQVGAVFSGLAGANDTHNTVAASMFNHNTLYSIVCTEMLNGVTFNGCHIFDGNAYVDDSMGFHWIGGILAAAITFDRGAAGHVGVSMIANTMFFSGSYGSGTITLTGSPSPTVLLKNNYYIGGEDSTALNN